MSGEENGSAERTSVMVSRGTRDLLEKCRDNEYEPLDIVVRRIAKAFIAAKKNHNGA